MCHNCVVFLNISTVDYLQQMVKTFNRIYSVVIYFNTKVWATNNTVSVLMFTFFLYPQFRSSVVLDIKRTFNATNENTQETKMLKRSLTIFGNVSNTSNMSAKKEHALSIITVVPVRLTTFLKSKVCFEYLKTYSSDYLSV